MRDLFQKAYVLVHCFDALEVTMLKLRGKLVAESSGCLEGEDSALLGISPGAQTWLF